MRVRYQHSSGNEALTFLKHAYLFLHDRWPHLPRETVPDRGFEGRFRESLVAQRYRPWSVSAAGETRLGLSIESACGAAHEIDIVAWTPDTVIAAELKNWVGPGPTKNDVVVFFSKLLDFVCANACLAAVGFCCVFIAAQGFEESGLEACLAKGIHPVAPGIRPFPVLADSVRRLEQASRGLVLPDDAMGRLDDLAAGVNRLGVALGGTWPDARWGQVGESSVVFRAAPAIETQTLAVDLRRLNGECTRLLEAFRAEEARRVA
jgi:hypothetical protein